MESCRRDLFVDMVVYRHIFKNNQITLSLCFTLIHWEKLINEINWTLVKIAKNLDSQTWLVNANRFASKRYRYTVLLTETFTVKSGNVY